MEGVLEVNKFEQVSSDGHQMSLAGGGALYIEVHCIMGNHHMGPHPPVNRYDWKYYLPVTSSVGGNNIESWL